MLEPDCFLRYRMHCNAEFYYVGKISRTGIGRPWRHSVFRQTELHIELDYMCVHVETVEFSLPTDDSRTTTVQSCDTKTRLLTPSPTLFTSNGHSTHVNTHRSPRDSTCSSTDKCASDTHDAIDDGMLSGMFNSSTTGVTGTVPQLLLTLYISNTTEYRKIDGWMDGWIDG